MAEILGVGLTHYPPMITPDEDQLFPLARTLKHNDKVPPEMKNPTSWPEDMRLEWGEDEGLTSAKKHRERLVLGIRELRAEIDAFNPDFVLIWGDDQYENFKEDIIPPFCVLAYEQMDCKPFTNKDGSPRNNVWKEPADKMFSYRGHSEAARFLISGLINQGIDMSYAYKPLHETGGLGHAFLNTLLYLDYDRKGFDYPVIPFQVNCYGSKVIRNRGGATEYEKSVFIDRDHHAGVHGSSLIAAEHAGQVLVVTPDKEEVGVEIVNLRPESPESPHQALPLGFGRR